MDVAKKGNLKKTESLLIAAENNAIRTNDIKVRIDKTKKTKQKHKQTKKKTPVDLGYVVIEMKQSIT